MVCNCPNGIDTFPSFKLSLIDEYGNSKIFEIPPEDYIFVDKT